MHSGNPIEWFIITKPMHSYYKLKCKGNDRNIKS